MVTKVGINGFGRVGRLVARALLERHPDTLEIAAINSRSPSDSYAHLFKYDSTYGRYPGTVTWDSDNHLVIDGHKIKALTGDKPSKIPWGDYGVDIVLECTGEFTDGNKVIGHLENGAKKVIISAAAKNVDSTIILGVNEDQYKPSHRIISCSSCTTNCIVPVAHVLQENFGIKHGFMSTVHAYTNDQRLQDGSHKDLRRARNAAINIVPTTTNAAKSVGEIMPALKGKVDGVAFRVPVATGSMIDFVVETEKPVSKEEVNAAFKHASQNGMSGILGYTDEPLVSSDFIGDTHSSIFDALSTMVIDEHLVKVIAWYDNEYGYSCRLADLAQYVTDRGL